VHDGHVLGAVAATVALQIVIELHVEQPMHGLDAPAPARAIGQPFDVEAFFADPALEEACAAQDSIDAGHGSIEERTARTADAGWLAERHPQWKGLQSIAAVTCLLTDNKTGSASKETRFFISSLPPDPAQLLAAAREHWGIESNLHWTLDVAFRENECRTRKDHSAENLAIMRHAAFNMLKREPTKISIKRKRVKAAINPDFRDALLKC